MSTHKLPDPFPANDDDDRVECARLVVWIVTFLVCLVVAIAGFIYFSGTAQAAQPRSAKAKADFKRLHPCPATGKPRGACPGYVIDHVVPLCAGGRDHHSNMQWQTVAESRVKDRDEVAQCARMRKAGRA